MPQFYGGRPPSAPEPDPLRGRDLAVKLDIGGDQTVKDLNPAEAIAKEMGVAVKDTIKTGFEIGTKVPILGDVAKAIGESPIGAVVGAGLGLLNIPSEIVQGIAARVRMAGGGLPQDIQNLINSGKSDEEIVKYMIETQRAFSNDQNANLAFTLLLDPLNYVGLGWGKIGALKPLMGAGGAIAGGAIAGSAIGPVGTVLGGIGGAIAGVKKTTSVVSNITEKLSASTKLLVDSGITKEAAAAQALESLSATEKAALTLNKGRGLNLGERLAVGSSMSNLIAKSERIKVIAEEAGDQEALRKAVTDIANAEKNIKDVNAIDSGFMLGMYKGIAGPASAAGNAAKRFASAMFVPATMAIQRRLGGYRVNTLLDGFTGIFGSQHKAAIMERAGRGFADFGIIGMQRALTGGNAVRAERIASKTAESYFQALKDLGISRINGSDPAGDVATIIQQMEKNADSQGGVQFALDTLDREKLAERVKYLRDMDQASMLRPRGSTTIPQIKELATKIESEFNISDVNRGIAEGTSVEETLSDKIRSVGADGFSKEGIKEIDHRVERLASDMSGRDKVKAIFDDHARSVAAARGEKFEGIIQTKADEYFAKTFGDHFDANGVLKKDGSAAEIAQDMLVIESASFSSANEAASTFNRSVDTILSNDPKIRADMISKIGEENYAVARAFAEDVGKIQVVRKNYLFRGHALAMTRLYEAIDTEAASARKIASEQRAAAPAIVAPGRAVVPVAEAGGAENVLAIRRQVHKMISEARANPGRYGDEYMDMLQKFRQGLEKVKNGTLDDVRRTWSEVTLSNLDDVRGAFGYIKPHDEVYQFLKQAMDQGLALRPITKARATILGKLMESLGMDPKLVNVYNEGAYRVTNMPDRNLITRAELIENPNMSEAAREVWRSKVAPFVDMTSQHLDGVVLDPRYKVNRVQHYMSALFDPIPQAAVTASVKRRLASYLARGGVSVSHSNAILEELVSAGIIEGVSARGLTGKQIYDSFKIGINRVGGEGSWEVFNKNFLENSIGKQAFNPTHAVMYSFRGDKNVIGLSQYATGGLKQWMPSLATWTDRWYPSMKFKMNPVYWLQEYVESPILNAARGTSGDTLKAIKADGQVMQVTGAEVRDLSSVGPETQALVDNVNFLAVFREDAIRQAMTGNYEDVVRMSSTMQNIKRGGALRKLGQQKEVYRDSLAMDIAAKQFSRELMNRDPSLWASITAHYGTTDAREVFLNYVDFRRSLTDRERVTAAMDASRPAGVGLNKIPDRLGARMSTVKQDLFGGAEYVDQATGEVTGVSRELLNDLHVENPHTHQSDLLSARNQMAEAGYDMQELEPAFTEARQASRNIEDWMRENGKGVEDLPVEFKERLIKAEDKLLAKFSKLEDQRMFANHRYHAVQSLMGQIGFAPGGNMNEVATRMAEALSLGRGYGEDAVEIANIADRVVQKVALTVDPKRGADFQRAVSEEMAREVASNPDLIRTFDMAGVDLMSRHSAEETVYNAFNYVYQKALDQANTTTYYNPNRSFFERTINHPMLGFYPYSYMYKKVLPELINFMFKKPFGISSPGSGYQAYMHVRDYIEGQIEQDPYFAKSLNDNSEVLYLLTSMFPGVPWDISAVPSPVIRNVATRLVNNTNVSPGNVLREDIIGILGDIGAPTALKNVVTAGEQLLTDNSIPVIESRTSPVARIR